ncbi:P-loop containing nucleoside triphosphate hydrolase protein [Nemania sp. FL0031]|nr:P-loop containing nucleoside triphosphate hydrolase protein [Nemania sp. FL0031]
MSFFVPRRVFEASSSITRSYFLGHHQAALRDMSKKLSHIDAVVECRDSRVPLTSANPVLEAALSGRPRIIVFTKSDLCDLSRATRQDLQTWQRTRIDGRDRGTDGKEHAGSTRVLLTAKQNNSTVYNVLKALKEYAARKDDLLELSALVVGMPNSGKSTLLNLLRRVGMGMDRPSVARVGAQPGITRKVGMPVRVVSESPARHPSNPLNWDHDNLLPEDERGVCLIDTPGVFVPYVSNVESMLKLSLVGCVKDGLVPAETIADYLLFHLNLNNPALYAEYCPTPTNDVGEFLEAVARRTGKLHKGGVPAVEQAADWIIQQWRNGQLGRFVLDDISKNALAEFDRKVQEERDNAPLSMNQARKLGKVARKAKNEAKRAAARQAAAL